MIDHNEFKTALENEVQELNQMGSRIRKELSDAPEGSLNVLQKRGRKQPEYYWYHSRDEREYIPRSDKMIAQHLAKKEYDLKLLQLVERRIVNAENLLKQYEITVDGIFQNMQRAKRELFRPIWPTDEEYVKSWYEDHPGEQNKYPVNDCFISNRGETMRSKSEKIIADIFQKHNIPYVYEPLVRLQNGKTVYPDFLVLNVRLRKTILFEHFGLMGDEMYGERTCEKFNLYMQNGIFVGDTLVFSMESKSEPLNTRLIEKLIFRYFV